MKYRYDEFNHNEFECHRLAMNFIERGSRVLDVGCATGYFAKELSKIDCETWGIDYDRAEARKAVKYCKKVFVKNIDLSKNLPIPKKYFGYVLLLDVVEHLLNPLHALDLIKPYIKDGGKIIISVPNVAHASIRLMLLKGHFDYTSTGILDKTHIHFFTLASIKKLLKDAGYKVTQIVPTNGMCRVPFLYKITDRLSASWQYKIVSMAPELFSYQFVVLAEIRKTKQKSRV